MTGRASKVMVGVDSQVTLRNTDRISRSDGETSSVEVAAAELLALRWWMWSVVEVVEVELR